MPLKIGELLERVPDPHRAKSVAHPLSTLLRLVLMGKLCGRVTVKAAWRMGQRLPAPMRQRLGFRKGCYPCYSTVTETLRQVDPADLYLVFATAVRGLGLEGQETVALDGKTLCGSRDGEAACTQVLGLFSTRLKGLLGGWKVPSGGTEATAALDLLEALDLTGLVVTADAMYCQPVIARKIVKQGGEYVLTVKDNKRRLKEAVAQATAAEEAALSP
jgi:hypothetical protein